MLDASSRGTVIGTRLRILAELDSSATISFMERSQLRLRVFGIVDALDRGAITTSSATELFAVLQKDVDVLEGTA
jgi:hypothetical protein